MLYYCRKAFRSEQVRIPELFLVAAIGAYFKCFFTGFDFASTEIVMIATPVVYYSLDCRYSTYRTIKAVTTALIGAASGTALGICTLLVQIGMNQGSLSYAIRHIITTIQRRSYSNPESFGEEYREMLSAPLLSVLKRTLGHVYLDFGNWLPAINEFVALYFYRIRMCHLILLLAFVSVLLARRSEDWHIRFGHAQRSLLFTAWFSLLAPISWFVAFKSLTAGHPHLIPLAWQMPFTLFAVPAIASIVHSHVGNLWAQSKDLTK